MRRFLPYFKYLRPVRFALIGGLLCGLLYGVSGGFGLPYLIKFVFPQVFGDNAALLTNWELFLLALWLPAIFTVRGVAGYFNTYLIQYCGVRILETLRLDYFRQLQILPFSFLQKQTSGDLLSRGISDTNQLQATLSALANEIIKQPATLISTVSYLAWQAYHERGILMVLVCLGVIPLCVLPIRYVGKRLARRSYQIQHEIGSITHIFSENLAAAREVRAYSLENREVTRFSRTTRALITYQMKAVKYGRALTPAIEVISAIGISVTLVYAYTAKVPLESFLALLAALYASYEPIKKLGALSSDLKRGRAALDRLEEILHEPIELKDPARPVPITRLRGELEFQDVTFTYKGATPALDRVSIHLPAGTTCALVGTTGAGKTTFANMVLRFYDPAAGRVLIDGLDLRDLRLADLRRQLALVSQDPILFNESIYENILLSRPEATRAEVEQAARDAFAHDFILAQPEGYETRVGERGASLSGGQRQRVALARAFLRDAPLLILDEATSALDSETENFVQQALKKLMVGRTTLIIAHRFSTIRDASKILVFDRGQIVAHGAHAELYASSPLYRTLYDRQATTTG